MRVESGYRVPTIVYGGYLYLYVCTHRGANLQFITSNGLTFPSPCGKAWVFAKDCYLWFFVLCSSP